MTDLEVSPQEALARSYEPLGPRLPVVEERVVLLQEAQLLRSSAHQLHQAYEWRAGHLLADLASRRSWLVVAAVARER